MNPFFDHEKLEVYQHPLAFMTWLEHTLQQGLIKANSDYRFHEGD